MAYIGILFPYDLLFSTNQKQQAPEKKLDTSGTSLVCATVTESLDDSAVPGLTAF